MERSARNEDIVYTQRSLSVHRAKVTFCPAVHLIQDQSDLYFRYVGIELVCNSDTAFPTAQPLIRVHPRSSAVAIYSYRKLSTGSVSAALMA